MKISDALSERRIELNPKSTCKDDIIAELVAIAAADGCIHDADAFLKKVMEREALHSTGLAEGIAIPHAQVTDVDGVIACIGVCRSGIEFDATDSQAVQIAFLIAANVNCDVSYLNLLSQIVRILGDAHIREQVLLAQSPREIIQIITKAEAELSHPLISAF